MQSIAASRLRFHSVLLSNISLNSQCVSRLLDKKKRTKRDYIQTTLGACVLCACVYILFILDASRLGIALFEKKGSLIFLSSTNENKFDIEIVGEE